MNDQCLTPNRATTVVFDETESVLVAPAVTVTRFGKEIAADVAQGLQDDTAGATDARYSNVKLWPSGAWTLRPIQDDISSIHERTYCVPNIISLPSKMTLVQTLQAAAVMAVVDRYRQNNDLPGFAASSNVQSYGDPWLVKRLAAGASWNNSITDTQTQPAIVTQDIPMDRVGISTATYPANQGYFLRWEVPGHGAAVYTYTWAFYFGQYGVSFTGTGKAQLWEIVGGTGSNGTAWRKRAEWRYARAGQLSDTVHTMAIWPHLGPNGEKFLCFSNGQLEVADLVGHLANSTGGEVAPGEFVYRSRPDLWPSYDVDLSGSNVTTANQVRFDIRRDLRLQVQISTLAWPTVGFLTDLPAQADLLPSANPIFVYPSVSQPTGTAITHNLLDPATGGAYTAGTSEGVQVRFTLSGDGTGTPLLWGYTLYRNETVQTAAPGSWTVGPGTAGKLRSVSASGYTGDPSHESAQLRITDDTASLTRLAARSRLKCRVLTTAPGAPSPVVLMEGYAVRPSATKRGKRGRVYPSPDWRDYDVPVQGMWMRLAERVESKTILRVYAKNIGTPTEPNGDGSQTWKVTDALIDLLGAAGFTDSQIAIPDLPIRLWPGQAGDNSDLYAAPGVNFAELILRLCRNYLGRYLLWEANGPSGGYWTLLTAPQPVNGAYTPVWNFVTDPALQAGFKPPIAPPHMDIVYGPNTSPVLGQLKYQNVPPECNHVTVVGQPQGANGVVRADAYNTASYAVPGFTSGPDPSSIDYIGYERPAQVYDAGTCGPDVPSTQAAVAWTCRRIYDCAAHGQRLCSFTSLLPILQDATLGAWRPLRFYDPVTLNGDATWVVKGVHPSYVKDGWMMATVELIQPYGGQYVPPGIESLNYLRAADKQSALHAQGAGSHSARWANLLVPAEQEARWGSMSLLATPQPLQNADGSFIAITNY